MILWLSCCRRQMEIDIYYKLVLSNGDAYKRSSVDRATVKHDADIIHLRDAVKLKNPQIPSTVGAAQLLVYKTREDLDNKRPITRFSTPVKDLGKDEDNAVFVVVPDDPQQQGTSV